MYVASLHIKLMLSHELFVLCEAAEGTGAELGVITALFPPSVPA